METSTPKPVPEPPVAVSAIPALPPASRTKYVWKTQVLARKRLSNKVSRYLENDPLLASKLGDRRAFLLPLRSSAVRDFTTCPRKFLWRHRLGFRTPHEYSAPLERGKWLHRRIELALQNPTIDPFVIDGRVLNEFSDQLDARIRDFCKDGIMPDGTPEAAFIDICQVDFYKSQAMAQSYLSLFRIVPFDYDRFEIEQTIHARVRGLSRPVLGRLDVLVREKSTGYWWIIDHKTTSSAPYGILDAYEYDIQTQFYKLLAMAAKPDEQVAGIIHNVIQTTSLKYCPRTKDREGGIDGYFARVLQWYKDKEAQGKFDPTKLPAVRSVVRFADYHLPSDLHYLLGEVGRRSHGSIRLYQFPRCADSYVCTKGVAFRACPYLPVCKQPTIPQQLAVLTSSYVQVDLTDLQPK